MGNFSTVMTTRSCLKCERAHRCGVQFKTGEDAALPVCDEHESLSSAPPGTYEGIVDAYCSACRLRWMKDEKEAHLLALAASVARGELTVRRGEVLRDERGYPIPDADDDFEVALLDERALSDDEIAAVELPVNAPYFQSFTGHLSDLRYVIFEGTTRVYPTRLVARSNWWERHDRAVGRELVDRGWPLGTSPWTDVAVVVSPERVVTVSGDMPG